MRILVVNRADPASTNIRDRLLGTGDWQPDGSRFRHGVVWEWTGADEAPQGEARMVEVDGPTITDELLDEHLRSQFDAVEAVWFLSKHRAESGHPSLTVHPIGNHGQALYGGQERTLSPSAARDMGALLRRLRVRAKEGGLPHSVTYEATHHGPLMRAPSLFVEIGSDEAFYADRAAGQALAGAIHDVLGGQGASRGPVLVGVGGGHYAPRQTDIAAAGKADFGHFLPSHFVEETQESPEALRRCIEATPGCAGVYLHRKGLKGGQRARVETWMRALGVPAWSSDEP